MTKLLTHDELIQKLENLAANLTKHVEEKMEVAVLLVEGEAKKNATLGQSPYEDMVFPTKMALYAREGKFKNVKMTKRPSVFVAVEGAYSGAPYSVDGSAVVHMRDTIYGEVDSDQTRVTGTVGTPKDYALYVHEGTSRMWGRPFITDAIAAKQNQVMKILSEAVQANLEEQAE